MTITARFSSIVTTSTGDWRRPLFIDIEFVFSIDGVEFTCPWIVGVSEIISRFPEFEFTTAWVGQTCTFSPVPRHTVVIDPVCSFFASEVI